MKNNMRDEKIIKFSGVHDRVVSFTGGLELILIFLIKYCFLFISFFKTELIDN